MLVGKLSAETLINDSVSYEDVENIYTPGRFRPEVIFQGGPAAAI